MDEGEEMTHEKIVSHRVNNAIVFKNEHNDVCICKVIAITESGKAVYEDWNGTQKVEKHPKELECVGHFVTVKPTWFQRLFFIGDQDLFIPGESWEG